jgi:hypothetical protein
MRLRKVTSIDPIARFSVSLKQSTAKLLEEYQAAYKKTYGEDIERSHLIEEILREYMQADKAFIKSMEPAEASDTGTVKKQSAE